MGKFVIEYTVEHWYRVEVEADSNEQAEEKFWMGECDFDSAERYGEEVQQDLSIYEREKVSA